jgi:hypothetical protein
MSPLREINGCCESTLVAPIEKSATLEPEARSYGIIPANNEHRLRSMTFFKEYEP